MYAENMGLVRRHPIVGFVFLIAGVALIAAGALAPSGRLPRSPVPNEVLLPFIFWQLAVWALLLGSAFLKPHRRPPKREGRPGQA